jgi:predicted metal-dependent HD superfamily phosphohydrolase
MPETSLLAAAETAVYQLLAEHLPPRYVFHDFNHAKATAAIAAELTAEANLPEATRNALIIAAWFQDVGYTEGEEGHEQRSAEQAKQFLKPFPETVIDHALVEQLILSTMPGQKPESKLEQWLHDAHYSFLGRKRFERRGQLLRLEEEAISGKNYTTHEWERRLLELQLDTKFLTPEAHEAFASRKNKNIAEQRDKIRKARKTTVRKKTGKDFGRGVDTVYRVTLRNHINLSSIADGKANMIISINTLVLSILITAGSAGFSISPSNFEENLEFILPVLLLMVTSLMAITFAVFSAIPKVSGQDFTDEDVKKHNVSLLYFGNFLSLPKEQFVGYLRDLKEDQEVLYDDLSRDLYNLGLVLKKKYRLLTYAYRTFVGGLVLSFLVFVFTFLLK